jgi:hypothetical protein
MGLSAIWKFTPKEAKLAGNQDMRAATESYSGFLTMFKWGALGAALAGILVVLIIA